MNTEICQSPALSTAETILQICGKHVDAEVAKRRALGDVLTIERARNGGHYWFDRENLRPFSAAINQ